MYAILIVEDDLTLQKTLVQFFETRNYKTSVANDGAEAFAAIQTTRPDVIILDILMPKVDGLEFFKQLTGTEFNGIPVIFLTNVDEREKKLKVLEQGAADYLVKSNVDLNEVERKVKELLEGKN